MMRMKRVILFGLILVVSVMFAGCGSKEKEEKAAEESSEDMPETEDTKMEKEESGYTLYIEDKSTSIQIKKPEGFDETEYISDAWLSFERPGEDSESYTQVNLYLMTDSIDTIQETMTEEIKYLISANSYDEGKIDEVKSIAESGREWEYFNYSLEELDGYRMWTELENGCVLICAAENVGNGLEPLDAEGMIQELSPSIQE